MKAHYIHQAPMSHISHEVARVYGFSLEQIRQPGRTARLSFARHVAFYLCREAGFSFNQIGIYFGGRDHSTVINGVGRISAIQDPVVKNEIAHLRDMLIPRQDVTNAA